MTGLDPRFLETLRLSMLSTIPFVNDVGTIDPAALLSSGQALGATEPAAIDGLLPELDVSFGAPQSQASTLAAAHDDREDSEEEAQSAAEALIPVPQASTSSAAAPPPQPEVVVGAVYASVELARGAINAVAGKLGLAEPRMMRPKDPKRATRFVCVRDKCLSTVNVHRVAGTESVCVAVSVDVRLKRSVRSR